MITEVSSPPEEKEVTTATTEPSAKADGPQAKDTKSQDNTSSQDTKSQDTKSQDTKSQDNTSSQDTKADKADKADKVKNQIPDHIADEDKLKATIKAIIAENTPKNKDWFIELPTLSDSEDEMRLDAVHLFMTGDKQDPDTWDKIQDTQQQIIDVINAKTPDNPPLPLDLAGKHPGIFLTETMNKAKSLRDAYHPFFKLESDDTTGKDKLMFNMTKFLSYTSVEQAISRHAEDYITSGGTLLKRSPAAQERVEQAKKTNTAQEEPLQQADK